MSGTDGNDTNGSEQTQTPSQLKRFSNKTQLLRHISETTGVSIDELWDEYGRQVNTDTNQTENKNE